MNTIIAKLLANKHTTAGGICYAVAKLGVPFLVIWWPSHQAQLEKTATLLEGASVLYMGLMAGDAKQSALPPVGDEAKPKDKTL